MLTEKLIFIMPDSLEELLFASTVMSQYLISRIVMGRGVKDVVVVSRWKELHSYLKACWIWAEVVDIPTVEQLEKSALVFPFDSESSYRMTEAVEKHIAEAFAIQLGVGLMRFLPAVLVEDIKEEPGMVLVAERNEKDATGVVCWRWNYLQDFVEMLKKNDIPVSFLGSEASWEEIRQAVGKASVVVGVRSSVTLVAAAANRIVMELQPSGFVHKNWFRKKECPTYRMIFGDLNVMTPEFVWKNIENLIDSTKNKSGLKVKANG